MNVAVVGTGGVGAALGVRWGQAGHVVTYGSRSPQDERVNQLVARSGAGSRAVSPREAVQNADTFLLAIPWPGSQESIISLGNLTGKTLIDCTNPLLADFSGIELGHVTSAAEQIAAWANGANVVKAFNTASVKVMLDPKFGDQRATMFYCGDDAAAKVTVKQLIVDVGFDPVDAGPLASSRYLEPLAMLYIHLAFRQGFGSNCAFKIMKR
jgi:predicted dinucleotide-binding enzyme